MFTKAKPLIINKGELVMVKVNLDKLDTERVNENSKNIDRVSTVEMIKIINSEDKKVAEAIERETENVAAAVDLIYGKMKNGGRLIYVGAGNSGRLGVLDACECPPTFGTEPGLVTGILAGGMDATVNSKEGAEDFEQPAIDELINMNLNENDSVVGLTASGRTPFVKGALRYSREVGAATVAVSCSSNAEISGMADVAIEMLPGAEVITGSTRLKAGTAQKMLLNMLSTGVMIKLGKVYGNYMVDVRSNNEKLVERSKRIITNVTGVSREVAEEYLVKSNKSVKLAVFMILSGLELEDAKIALEKNENTIAKALDSVK